MVWNHGILCLHILGISSSQLTNSYFSEGWWKTTNQCSFDGCDLETLNIFEWEFMGCDGIIIDFFLLMIWMRCDWILRNFRSECCCVFCLQFWTVEQDASSKKCDEMCCQEGLAFSIWDFTIKHIQISRSNEGSDGVYNGHCQLRRVSSPIDYLKLP